MAKSKWYVVLKGRQPGIYATWEACKAQVDGFSGAKFKSFDSREAAETAFASQDLGPSRQQPAPRTITAHQPIEDSYSVDAACSGNPGLLEYRCLYNPTGETVFLYGPFAEGTNNIGEFLAIVDALTNFQKQDIQTTLYSNSQVAMGWVKRGVCGTKLEQSPANAILFQLIEDAEQWLTENTYATVILKWDTQNWGQIPADFGRK